MFSQVMRISTGYINSVNDGGIGQLTAPTNGLGSSFAGQLGKRIEMTPDMIRYLSANGTIYGGTFRYVRLASGAGVPVVGQILFWDETVDQALYQVTTSESGTTDAAVNIAGICLTPLITVGNYTIIQDEGIVPIKFRAALTDAGAIGSRCYAAAVGGADLGLADVLNDGTGSTFATTGLMQARFLGVAQEAPSSGGTKKVYMRLPNYRG